MKAQKSGVFGYEKQCGLKTVLDVQGCVLNGLSMVKQIWICTLSIFQDFILHKNKKILLKHDLSKTPRPSILLLFTQETPTLVKESCSLALFIQEKKSLGASLITKSLVGSEPLLTKATNKNSINICKRYLLGKMNGIDAMYLMRLLTQNT